MTVQCNSWKNESGGGSSWKCRLGVGVEVKMADDRCYYEVYFAFTSQMCDICRNPSRIWNYARSTFRRSDIHEREKWDVVENVAA